MSSTAKYEKLIDLIINEDQEKAQALFHDIVVETSREIYESLLNEDMTSGLIDEISAEEDGMHGMMEDDEEFIDDEEIDGDYDVDGGDDEQIDTEVSFDGDDMEAEEGEAELEDRVVDLEDKLDELMAEFESILSIFEIFSSELSLSLLLFKWIITSEFSIMVEFVKSINLVFSGWRAIL